MSFPKTPGFPAQKKPSRFSKNVSKAAFAIEELRDAPPAPRCHAYPKGKSRCRHLCKLDPGDLDEVFHIALGASLPYNYSQTVVVSHALLCDTHMVQTTFCVPLVLGLLGVHADEAPSCSPDGALHVILRPKSPNDGPPLEDVIDCCNEEIQRTGAGLEEAKPETDTSATSPSPSAASSGIESSIPQETSQGTLFIESSDLRTGESQSCGGQAHLDFFVAKFNICFGDRNKFNCIAYNSAGERCKHNLGSHCIETAQDLLKRDFGRPPLLSSLEPLILMLLCTDHSNALWRQAYYLKWSPSFVDRFRAQSCVVPDRTVTDAVSRGVFNTPFFGQNATYSRAKNSPSPFTFDKLPDMSLRQQTATEKHLSHLELPQHEVEHRKPWLQTSHQGSLISTAPMQASPHLPEVTVHEDASAATTRDPRTPEKISVSERTPFSPSPVSRTSASPSPGLGFKASPMQKPTPCSGDKYTQIKAPSQLEQFGFKTRFGLLEDPGIQDMLSDDSRQLLNDLKSIQTGGVIPQELKAFLVDDRLGQGLQAKHFSPESIRPHKTSWDTVQVAMAQWHRIHELLEASWECEKDDLFESAWNAEVHSVVLRLALQGEKRKKTGVWYRDVTTASINHSCLPPPIPGTTRIIKKMVDYAMIIEPLPNLADSIDEKVRHRGETSINHTDQSHVLKTPIAVGIETKRPGSDEFAARAQLIVWVAAHFSRLHQLLKAYDDGTSRKDIPEMPLILVQGNEWKLAFAKTEAPDEYKMCFMRYVTIGKTDSILGIYTLIASLRRLGQWASDVYQPWFRAYILGLEA